MLSAVTWMDLDIVTLSKVKSDTSLRVHSF